MISSRAAIRSLLALFSLMALLATTQAVLAETVTLVVENTMPVQTIEATLDMVGVSNTQAIEIRGVLVADVTFTADGNGGHYLSSFQALGGELVLGGAASIPFDLSAPTTSCYGTGGVDDYCDPLSGFCTETVMSIPGESLVSASMRRFRLQPGGAALSAQLTDPGSSTFELFDPATPGANDNFKLTAIDGIYQAEGCALNEDVFESRAFGCPGCESDFWGFPGEASVLVNTASPVDMELTLPMDHNLLVIGWDGLDPNPEENYGIMNLSGDVRFVPEPGGALGLVAGSLLLCCLSGRRRRDVTEGT